LASYKKFIQVKFVISVTTAEALLLAHARKIKLPATLCSAADASFSLSRNFVVSERPFPPYPRVAMDGIALAYDEWQKGCRRFQVTALQGAGSPPLQRYEANTAIEVMTGAVLPEGCDTVVRYEDFSLQDGTATLPQELILRCGQNVQAAGSDAAQGSQLIAENSLLLPPHWAIIASCGTGEISLAIKPRIALIATGDELVPLAKIPLAHQLRASTIYAVAAALRDRGFSQLETTLVSDDPQALHKVLAKALTDNQVLVITGGVSAGKRDFVPAVLADLGVHELFHGVAQRPGKPLWVGSHPQGNLIIALPGNPVAALICAYRYLIPALWAMLAADRLLLPRFARLAADLTVKSAGNLTFFVPVTLRYCNDGATAAAPCAAIGSGDLVSISQSDGFVEVPPGISKVAAGEALRFYSWSSIL
jgi:molybdopterin molybdotransferase